MAEFEQYIKELCDYIEECMNVTINYDKNWDELNMTFIGTDEIHMMAGNITGVYNYTWRHLPVGAVACRLMCEIEYMWRERLMRKDGK